MNAASGSNNDIQLIPVPGSLRPGVASVRLVGPPDVLDAALDSLSAFYGDAWQPSTRKPSRHGTGEMLLYGTLIVAVPK